MWYRDANTSLPWVYWPHLTSIMIIKKSFYDDLKMAWQLRKVITKCLWRCDNFQCDSKWMTLYLSGQRLQFSPSCLELKLWACHLPIFPLPRVVVFHPRSTFLTRFYKKKWYLAVEKKAFRGAFLWYTLLPFELYIFVHCKSIRFYFIVHFNIQYMAWLFKI